MAKVAIRTKTQPLEKIVKEGETLAQDKVKPAPKVKKMESEKDAIINGPKQSKPVEKDVHEKLQTRPGETSDVQQQEAKKVTTTTSNAMKNNKVCGGEQKIKIENGKKAKSPETGSRSVHTDTCFANDAHAIISDVANDKLSVNQCVLLGERKNASITTDTTVKNHLNDETAQDNKSLVVVGGATSTAVIVDKSSAALRKDTHFDKGKAIAMTNVKDADTTTQQQQQQQQTTTTGNDDVVCDNDENLTRVNNITNEKDNNVDDDDESIVINANLRENSDENKKEEVCDGNRDIDTILDITAINVQDLPNDDDDNATQNAIAKFPTCDNLTNLTVEHDQLNNQLDNTCETESNHLTRDVTEDNCTLRSSKEAGKPIPLEEDEEQDLQKEPQTQVNKIDSSDSNTEETSFSTDCSATEDWSSEESEDEEEKQRLKARENLLLLLRMARNDDTPVAAAKPAPQKKMLLDLDKMKKCYAKEEKAVITLVAKPKPLWKYVRRNKPHKKRNRKLLEKAQELERLEREGNTETSEHGEPTTTTQSDDSQASDANSSTKNSKSSASSDYTEYYDFSFPYYVKDEDNNLLVNSRLSQRSIDSGIGGGSSEASSSFKDPTGEFS